MDYIVNQTKQIAVTADSPEEAQKKVLNGEGTAISSNLGAQPRPQQTQSTQTFGKTGSQMGSQVSQLIK